MTGWLEIAVVAFVAQLAVLPGEKVQFIIAGLSTRFEPPVVVGAAGAAFAGWTALEILFGQALQAALPPIALEAFTAALFLLFAVLLWRSAPDQTNHLKSDGGLAQVHPDVGLPSAVGDRLPDRAESFLAIFAMMAVGEFGDKTQLITIGLAAKFGASSAIWVGEMAAIIPVSLANAYFFHRFADRFDPRKAHYAAAVLFAFFGADTVLAIVTDVSVWERIVGAISAAILAFL
ncbi:hypothetical protein BRC82_03205 [Halobacteriales archaeon QS_1_67_19]|nr:MAG: hypothetical protein BRC82_03205 [Halobacteriales archaeon QS_1_67_19]